MKLTTCIHWLWSTSHDIRLSVVPSGLVGETGAGLLVTHRQAADRYAASIVRLNKN